MIEFAVLDEADQQFGAIIANKRVTIRLRYNVAADRWAFDLSIDDTPVLHGRRIVTGVDLLAPFDFGIGAIFAYAASDLDFPDRASLPSGRVRLFQHSEEVTATTEPGSVSAGDEPGDSVVVGADWTVVDVTGAGGVTLQVARNRVIRLTLTGNATVQINAPGLGATEFLSFVLKVVQGAGAPHEVDWQNTIHWAGAYAPSLNQTVGGEDLFQFMSWDGGASWNAGRIVQFGG